MIVVNYNGEELADAGKELFIFGLKELEKEHSVLINPILERDRLMKREILHGFKNQMDNDLINECNHRFVESYKKYGCIG